MAKVERKRAAKEHVCSKCGVRIFVGQDYLTGSPYRRKPIDRCTRCGLKAWELSSSEYVRSVAPIVEDWKDTYGRDDGTAQSIADDLQEILDSQEERLENMPENLRESESGQTIQERIDTLTDAISELGNCDWDSLEDDAFETVSEDNPRHIDENTGEEETDDEYFGRINDILYQEKQDMLEEQINDALSVIAY